MGGGGAGSVPPPLACFAPPFSIIIGRNAVTRKILDPRRQDEGFTLIELLVVMIIIGILAAIAIPVFLNQRAKARDTATKSDIETIGKELATFYVDGDSAVAVTGTISGTNLTLAAAGYSNVNRISTGTTYLTAATTNAITYQTGANCNKGNGWVVNLRNPDGATKNYYFSATSGLSSTAPTLTAACA